MKKSGESSFLDAIKAVKKIEGGRTTGFACTVSRFLDSLSQEEREALESLLDNTDISIRRIAELLLEHGHSIGVDVLRRHRNRQRPGGCKCLRNVSQ